MPSFDISRESPLIFAIDPHGWLKGARQVPSPNFNQRPPGAVIDTLVVHNISLPPGQFGGPHIEALFTNTLDYAAHPFFSELVGLEVSAHLLIRRDGEVVQFVSFDERAWHAGQSSFSGRENCNDFSIGIELEGTDDQSFTQIQYERLAQVIRCLVDQYPAVSGDRIVGHSDIAPGRKTDPGPYFQWQTLASLLPNDEGKRLLAARIAEERPIV